MVNLFWNMTQISLSDAISNWNNASNELSNSMNALLGNK